MTARRFGGSYVFALFALVHCEREHDAAREVHTKKEGSKTAHNTDPQPTTTQTAYVPTNVEVPSCTCVSRGEARNTFVLQPPTLQGDARRWYFGWTPHLVQKPSGYSSMSSGFYAGASDAGLESVVPLAPDATKLRAAMACEGEIVALVSGSVASAWSGSDNGELIWTHKLPAPMADATDDVAPSSGTMFDVACTGTLPVAGGVFTVPLAKGKKITLSIQDGTTR
jgi:hypothetical protein